MSELLVVVGARPNFVKAAPVIAAARARGLDVTLVHTNQHYDDDLSQIFFDELDLPAPHMQLGVGSGSHATQTARIMTGFERVLLEVDPAIVVVAGDVNSTLACALVAAKEHYPVAHVESGLRSFDERMPEEINRRLTDHLSGLLFTTSVDANDNLRREGIAEERIAFVGNTMIDTLVRCVDEARGRQVAHRLGLHEDAYAVATLHRPENVDDPSILDRLVEALTAASRVVPVVLPLHPRTRARLEGRNGGGFGERVLLLPPLGYVDFLGLVADATVVLTDSGGLQEETTALGVPCLTLRDTTERPVTVTVGTNVVVGTDPARVLAHVQSAVDGMVRPGELPPLWDGRAGERVAAQLEAAVARRRARVHAVA